MQPSGRIKHTGPPQSTAGRGLRPDAPVFTPQGHYDEPHFGPPQQMYQNPNQPPTSNVFSYSRAVKKQPGNVNYEWGHFQNIQNEMVQPIEPADITPINNPPQPYQENSTTSWRVASNSQQSERQGSQRNDYQKENFQNNQIESVQPFEPENIRNVPQPNQTNSTTPWAVDNNVQPNERQNRQDFSLSDYKGNSAKGTFNKNSQKSARVDESCNLYQEIDGRPQNHSGGQRNRYNTSGQGHSRSKDIYQKENDQRRSTKNFNKNTADYDNSNNSAAEVNTVSGSRDDEEEKPIDSAKKFKTKDDNSKRSKNFDRELQETRSGYGNRHNNRGHNYDSKRTSFNKNTADHDDSNNSAAEANTVSDSWRDRVEKPIESTKKFKTKDETSKWRKDFKRDPQETRSGYGNPHNNRGYKPRDNNYDPRRTSTNNSSKYSADNNRDNSNNSAEHQITPESWEDNEDIPSKNIPVIDSQDDDVREHTKLKEEPKAKDTKNADSRQRHERSPINVHQDKRATDSKEKIDENDSAWNAEFSSTPEKPEQTSKQCEYQRNKPKDPRMDREKLNKSESSIFQDQSNIDKTVRRSDGNYRHMSSGVSDKDKEIWDKEFNKWDREWKRIKDFKIVTEIEGDLFEQPKEYSLAHCVAEDLKMGSGIAVAFKREFKNVPDLLDQRAKQGGLAVLPDEKNKRFVYYLVTKRESNGKPTYFTLWKSLCNMKEHIKQNGVKNLAIPRLACGLDRLEWDMVKSMIEFLFADVDVKITVCNFQQNHGKTKKKLQTHAPVDKGKSKKNRNKK